MRNYRLSLNLCCANQAVLPTAVASHCLDACLLMSSKLHWYLVLSIVFIINSGLFRLKTLSQTWSNREKIKNTVIIHERTSKNVNPLSKNIKGNSNTQPKSLISLTFGICLANRNSCSGDISQSTGIESGFGKTRHNLSFRRCNTTSAIVPTMGYMIKKTPAKLISFIKKFKKKVARPVTRHFASIANNPDEAITLGLAKKILIPMVSLKNHHFPIISIAQEAFNCI